MMSSSPVSSAPSLLLSSDNVICQNLKSAAFQMSTQPMADTVISIASSADLLFVSVAHNGLGVYRVVGSSIVFIGQLGGCANNCYDLLANRRHLAYITEDGNSRQSICVHPMTSFADNDVTVGQMSHAIHRRAPFTLQLLPGLLIIGGAAWTSSWTSNSAQNKQITGVSESHVVVLAVETFQVLTHWKAAEHSVSIIHSDVHAGRSMLSVADSRAGINVYEMSSAHTHTFLYHIDVDEIRNFQLVGPCVAVFHRFEPNISFWNVVEQRTILCINVQDQARQLSEEFTEPAPSRDDAVEECSLLIDDDDHVTAVTSIPVDGGADQLLVYGTVSGCVFGMSVQRRSKVFSIPCPHLELHAQNAVLGLAFLPTGQLVATYHGRTDVTLLHFGVDNPPDRPPTRCGTVRRDTTLAE